MRPSWALKVSGRTALTMGGTLSQNPLLGSRGNVQMTGRRLSKPAPLQQDRATLEPRSEPGSIAPAGQSMRHAEFRVLPPRAREPEHR